MKLTQDVLNEEYTLTYSYIVYFTHLDYRSMDEVSRVRLSHFPRNCWSVECVSCEIYVDPLMTVFLTKKSQTWQTEILRRKMKSTSWICISGRLTQGRNIFPFLFIRFRAVKTCRASDQESNCEYFVKRIIGTRFDYY